MDISAYEYIKMFVVCFAFGSVVCFAAFSYSYLIISVVKWLVKKLKPRFHRNRRMHDRKGDEYNCGNNE